MRLVVADANVFAALFQAGLLDILFSDKWLEVYVPKEVFDEVTNKNRRIAREFPELPELAREAAFRHGANKRKEDGINLIDIEESLTSTDALKVYFELTEAGVLDRGEIESIPLALEIGGIFVSDDEDAITHMRDLPNETRGNATASSLKDFLSELRKSGILTKENYEKLLEVINS